MSPAPSEGPPVLIRSAEGCVAMALAFCLRGRRGQPMKRLSHDLAAVGIGACLVILLGASVQVTREEFAALERRVTRLEQVLKARGLRKVPRHFLNNCRDPELRMQLYDLYLIAEPEARRFALWRNWRPIVEVVAGEGASWGPKGQGAVIRIRPDKSDMGALFHELFHGAFDHSPLQRNNDKWGEAFCNAFRYFMEARLIPDSPWLAGFNTRLPAGVNLKYMTPHPDLILLYCQQDYDRFLAFWIERQSKPNESLDQFFTTCTWPK